MTWIFRKPTCPSLPLREGPPFSPIPFSWRRLAALGNMKANFHCAHLHNLSPQGTRDVPTALLGAQTASLYGWRGIRALASWLCGMGPQGEDLLKNGCAGCGTAGTRWMVHCVICLGIDDYVSSMALFFLLLFILYGVFFINCVVVNGRF